ncbi:hypothetical protein BaRGS_00018472, partial [Batillaria attramentaria]
NMYTRIATARSRTTIITGMAMISGATTTTTTVATTTTTTVATTTTTTRATTTATGAATTTTTGGVTGITMGRTVRVGSARARDNISTLGSGRVAASQADVKDNHTTDRTNRGGDARDVSSPGTSGTIVTQVPSPASVPPPPPVKDSRSDYIHPAPTEAETYERPAQPDYAPLNPLYEPLRQSYDNLVLRVRRVIVRN